VGNEDWFSLGRDLIARGIPAPMLVVADGVPGLIKAVEQCWSHSDRQHCCVHQLRIAPARVARIITPAGGLASIDLPVDLCRLSPQRSDPQRLDH
jgi:transposase-like protein